MAFPARTRWRGYGKKEGKNGTSSSSSLSFSFLPHAPAFPSLPALSQKQKRHKKASYARRTEFEELRRAFEALSSGAGASSSKQGSEKTDLPPQLSVVITPASLAAAALSVGHALDATAAKDAIWEVDDDLDGAVNWREFKAAAARVAWGGGDGFVVGEKNASSSPSSSSPVASPSPSPSPLSRRGGSSSASLLDAHSDAHPRTLVDIGLFLARADESTGRLATSALERAAHLRDGRAAIRSALADAAGAAAAAAAAGNSTTLAATTSLSLGEYLDARRGAQARALRAAPASPLPASSSHAAAAAAAVAAATGGAVASSAAAPQLKRSTPASRGGTCPRGSPRPGDIHRESAERRKKERDRESGKRR